MQITKPTKAEVTRELKDYIFITLGLISYALGWAAFLIPYQITTGGTTGIGAIIYYATGFPIQWSYFIINAVLMTFAIKILGPKFSIKTTFAIFGLTFFLWFFQLLVNGSDGVPPQLLGEGQDFMACLIGAAMCGAGLGIVFNCNGSTGGTDIIAAIIHKYKDVTLGRMIMACDFIIISSCYVVFHDWRRVIFGFVTLFVIGFVLDYIVNSARQFCISNSLTSSSRRISSLVRCFGRCFLRLCFSEISVTISLVFSTSSCPLRGIGSPVTFGYTQSSKYWREAINSIFISPERYSLNSL